MFVQVRIVNKPFFFFESAIHLLPGTEVLHRVAGQSFTQHVGSK